MTIKHLSFNAPRPLKTSTKESLFSELRSLLVAGLDFSRSFSLLIEGEGDKAVKSLLEQLYAHVVRGDSLHQAMRRSGRFTPLDEGVVRIGEQTGRLHEALDFLSDYYRRTLAQRRMVTSAVTYPVVILSVAVIVVVFMLLVVVPMFEQVYSRMGGELPALTRAIIAFSKGFPAFLTVFALIAIPLATTLYLTRERDAIRSARAELLLHLPFAGAIVKKNTQARFCKLLYLLTSSGIPLVTCIEMLQTIITLYPYQQSFRRICDGLRRGELFADCLARHPTVYDRKLITLLRVGEQTSRLPEMLSKQADDLTRQTEHALRQLGSMLEPILITLIGTLVAVILISMYLPMFRLGNVMG